LSDVPGPSPLIVAGRSNPFSALLCSTMSDTRVHCRSENRSLKVVVSGSLASSTMLPTELAVSDSVSDMFSGVPFALLANADISNYAKIAMSRGVASSFLWWGKALRLVCFCGRCCGVGSSRLPYLLCTSFHSHLSLRMPSTFIIFIRAIEYTDNPRGTRLQHVEQHCEFLILCLRGATQLIAPSIMRRSAMPSSYTLSSSVPTPYHSSSCAIDLRSNYP